MQRQDRQEHVTYGKLGKVVLLQQREPALYPKEMLGFYNKALDVLLSGILFTHVAIKSQKANVIRTCRS